MPRYEKGFFYVFERDEDKNIWTKALLYCALTGGQGLQLIMEFLPQGSLAKYLPKHKPHKSQLLIFAQQICQVSFVGIY